MSEKAQEITEALHRLCTGDQDPPRPWAYMSGVGQVGQVSEVGGLTVRGYVDTYAFELTVDGTRYRIMVQALGLV